MSKISLIIPVYNVEAYLNRCLDSVFDQSLEVEVIVVDDGSTDNSPQILDQYRHHANLTVIRKENGGISSARNAGLAVARGEYVLFLDSDDLLMSKAIDSLIPYLDGTDIVLAQATQRCLDGTTRQIKHDLEGSCSGIQYLDKNLPARFPVMVWLNAYRKAFLDSHKLRFVKEFVHEDEDFTLRALLKAQSVTCAPVMLLWYILRQQSMTTSKRKRQSGVALTRIAFEIVKFSDLYPSLSEKLKRHAVKLYIKAFRHKGVHTNNLQGSFSARLHMFVLPMSLSDRLKMGMIVLFPGLYEQLFSLKHDRVFKEDV